MYPYFCNSINYDKISSQILEDLVNFSGLILAIGKINNTLLTDDNFNQNSDFMQYLAHFDLGRYFHFRCQGFMEALILTKCYSPISICYWLNNLVYPASAHFMEAFTYFDKVKAINSGVSNNEFIKLVGIIDEFKRVSMRIMNGIKLYNIEC